MTAEESDEAVTKAIERRRRAIEAEWNELGAVVLIGAGDPIPIPGRADRVYPFLAHSEYFYLTDHQRPGAVLAYDPQEGWSEFVRVFSADERLWSGELGDDVGTPASELARWLEKRRESRHRIESRGFFAQRRRATTRWSPRPPGRINQELQSGLELDRGQWRAWWGPRL